MKTRAFAAIILLFLLSACQSGPSVCPPATGTPARLTVSPQALPTATAGPSPMPVVMKIGGKDILVNKVVSGPLCNDTWSGTVYVTCDIQVYPWAKQPTFLDGCNLNIAPGTVVYVASHNDTAYYNGCSCHYSKTGKP